jgi:hypothetical protein
MRSLKHGALAESVILDGGVSPVWRALGLVIDEQIGMVARHQCNSIAWVRHRMWHQPLSKLENQSLL